MTGGSEFIDAPAGTRDAEADAVPLVAVRDVARIFPGGPSSRGGPSSEPVRALDGVSLAIPPGTVFTLLGPSGCGKTTLLRLIAGFEHPDRGDILLDGRSILGDPPNRRPVNTLFQSYALFPHMSVADNVGFGLRCRGLRGRKLDDRVREALALVRLEALAGRRPAALSGGQQQRVALARALAPRPRMVLLDEPLSALDPKLRRGMQVELKRIQRESGIAFLLVTHDREEAFSLSDRIAVMEAGRILQVGSPRDIVERPASRAVADFTGANVLDLDEGCFAVRPERIAVHRLGQAPNGGASGADPFAGRVAGLVYLGGRTSCTVALERGGTLTAERDDLPDGLAVGEAVACRPAGDALVPLRDR